MFGTGIGLSRYKNSDAYVAVVAILIILLGVCALIVVNALKSSPWGTFTIAMTMPIALLMGVYLRRIRPGKWLLDIACESLVKRQGLARCRAVPVVQPAGLAERFSARECCHDSAV